MKKFQVCFSGPIDQRFPLDSLKLCALVAGKTSWKVVHITVQYQLQSVIELTVINTKSLDRAKIRETLSHGAICQFLKRTIDDFQQ